MYLPPFLDSARLFSSEDGRSHQWKVNGKWFLALSSAMDVKCYIIMVLICISLITSEHVFICSLAVLSSVNACLPFVHFSIELHFFSQFLGVSFMF